MQTPDRAYREFTEVQHYNKTGDMKPVFNKAAQVFSGEVRFKELNGHEDYGECIVIKSYYYKINLLADNLDRWFTHTKYKNNPCISSIVATLEQLGYSTVLSPEETRTAQSSGQIEKLKDENKQLKQQIRDLEATVDDLEEMLRNQSQDAEDTDDKFDDLFEEAGLNEPKL